MKWCEPDWILSEAIWIGLHLSWGQIMIQIVILWSVRKGMNLDVDHAEVGLQVLSFSIWVGVSSSFELCLLSWRREEESTCFQVLFSICLNQFQEERNSLNGGQTWMWLNYSIMLRKTRRKRQAILALCLPFVVLYRSLIPCMNETDSDSARITRSDQWLPSRPVKTKKLAVSSHGFFLQFGIKFTAGALVWADGNLLQIRASKSIHAFEGRLRE